ncbi:MAG: sigma-70 family RNA polymerase sigma factor [Planctomycetota bacterium]
MSSESDKSSGSTLRARASAAYANQSREAVEERWILDHLPLVRHIVQKIASQVAKREDIEDLISAGTLGLVKAARSFDPTREAEFKTYAYIRIRGSVIDELRRRSFVPTAVHKQIRTVKQAYQQWLSEHGAPPTDEQLAALLNIPIEQLYKVLEEARKQHFLSIHGLTDESPELDALVPADNDHCPQEEAQHNETLGRLSKAIMELPKRDRIILILYYERDLTMKETAAVLEITESRVSQLHASAMFKLSMKLKSK